MVRGLPHVGLVIALMAAVSFLLGTFAGAQTTPPQSHPASEITAGDFAAGNYKIRGQLTFDLNGNPGSGLGTDAIIIDADDSFTHAAITLEKPQTDLWLWSKAAGQSGSLANLVAGAGTFSGPLASTGRMVLSGTGSSGSVTAGMWLAHPGSGSRAFIGMASDNEVGFFGNMGVGWGLKMDVATGDVTIAKSLNAKGVVVGGGGECGWTQRMCIPDTGLQAGSPCIPFWGQQGQRNLDLERWGSATCSGTGQLACPSGTTKRLVGTASGSSSSNAVLLWQCIRD